MVQMRGEWCFYRCWDIAYFVLRVCWTFVITPRCGALFFLVLSWPFFSLSISMQLQKLKRSLSFKTMMRSKSVENFFQRSFSDARMPPDFITDPPPPSPPLLPGSPLVNNRSPSISPSVSPNPSISSHSPSLSLSPSLPAKPPHCQITHCFQDHVFRKPTNCQHCMNTIVGKEPILLSFIHLFKIWGWNALLMGCIQHKRQCFYVLSRHTFTYSFFYL